MSSEFVTFEEQLRSLLPSELQINRDQLIYSAGARAGRHQTWRICRVWLASTAAASLLIVGVLGVLMTQPDVMKNGGDIKAQTQSSQHMTGMEVAAAYNGDIKAQTQSSQHRPSHSVHDSTWDDFVFPAQSPHDPGQRAFSGIHNVDSWSREELQKRGISVRSWKHALQSEDPPLNWAEITFDTTQAPANQGILMTAWFTSDSGVSENASRAQTEAVEVKSLVLLVAIGEGHRKNSYIDILIWKPTPEGGSEAQGYKISAKRMIELAGEK